MMVRSLKWTVLTSWAVLPAVVCGGLDALEKRGSNATTDVVCQSTYLWMNNQNNQTPCLVASALSGVCATAGGWNVPALGPNDAYSLPNSSTANACICSWAVYNLLGACTVCQGNAHVDNWSPYKAGCGSFTTDTYWPMDYTVQNNTLLPFWAATDPSTWSDGSFNSSQASSIHSQGKSDINLSASSQSSSSSSSNAGAIAGGIVGGLAAVAGLVVLFFYLRHRKRHKPRKLLDPLPNATSQTIHGRSLSDTSQTTVIGTNPVGFSPDFRPTASPPNMYTSSGAIALLPTSHIASHSVHSLPYDLSIIGDLGSTSQSPPLPPSQQAMLSPRTPTSGGHPQTLENVIVPYTLTSSSQDLSSTDRKRVDGNLFPIFEQQNEYQSGPSNDQPATSRRRMNPPTYTESATGGESSVIRSLAPSRSVDLRGRGHGHQGSSDTNESGMTHTHGNGTESSWSPMPRRTEVVRESALSEFSGITGIGSDLGGPSSVIGVGSAAINSPIDSQARTNLMGVAGSVVGGDDIA